MPLRSVRSFTGFQFDAVGRDVEKERPIYINEDGRIVAKRANDHFFQDQVYSAQVSAKVDLSDIQKHLSEQCKKNTDTSNSTATLVSLSANGELKGIVVGDSPIYLVVDYNDGGEAKECVIQITEDMDADSERYSKIATDIYKDSITRDGRMESSGSTTFGAINNGYDANDTKRIRTPEYYDWSQGVHHEAINTFLKNELKIENANINELLKNGIARVVVSSDGLADEKLTYCTDEKNIVIPSVAHYKVKLQPLEDHNILPEALKDLNHLPLPTKVEFIKVPDKKTEMKACKVPNTNGNISYIYQDDKRWWFLPNEQDRYDYIAGKWVWEKVPKLDIPTVKNNRKPLPTSEIPIEKLEGDKNPIILISRKNPNKVSILDAMAKSVSQDDIAFMHISLPPAKNVTIGGVFDGNSCHNLAAYENEQNKIIPISHFCAEELKTYLVREQDKVKNPKKPLCVTLNDSDTSDAEIPHPKDLDEDEAPMFTSFTSASTNVVDPTKSDKVLISTALPSAPQTVEDLTQSDKQIYENFQQIQWQSQAEFQKQKLTPSTLMPDTIQEESITEAPSPSMSKVPELNTTTNIYQPVSTIKKAKNLSFTFYNLLKQNSTIEGDPQFRISTNKEVLKNPDAVIITAMKQSIQEASRKTGFPLTCVAKLINFAQQYGGVGNAKNSEDPLCTPEGLFCSEFGLSLEEGLRLFQQAKKFSAQYQREMKKHNLFTGRKDDIREDINREEIGARLTRIPPHLIEEVLKQSSMQEEVSEFINQLKKNKINVVSFDFDQTLTKYHLFNILFGKNVNSDIKKAYNANNEEEFNKIFGSEQIEFIQELFEQIKKANIEIAITSKNYEWVIRNAFKFAKIDINNIKIIANTDTQKDPNSMNKSTALTNKYSKTTKILHIDDDSDEIRDINNKGQNLQGIHVPYENSKPGFSPSTISSVTNQLKSAKQEVSTRI